jgi:ketosteroid isomerase-like protein
MSKGTQEVGKRLVELCKANKNVQAIDELYAPNVVSIEAGENPSFPKRMEGIEAIRKKNQWWIDNHEIHSGIANGPWPNADKFIVHFKYDVTSNAGPMKGKRMQIEEGALYTVKDGKIVQEEFFYDMGG